VPRWQRKVVLLGAVDGADDTAMRGRRLARDAAVPVAGAALPRRLRAGVFSLRRQAAEATLRPSVRATKLPPDTHTARSLSDKFHLI
jgi:hypothetical protein